jgi:hypothetical protein
MKRWDIVSSRMISGGLNNGSEGAQGLYKSLFAICYEFASPGKFFAVWREDILVVIPAW